MLGCLGGLRPHARLSERERRRRCLRLERRRRRRRRWQNLRSHNLSFLAGLRREHVDEIVERLLEIAEQARAARDPAALAGLAREVDRLAADAVRYARERAPDAATMSAVAIALDTARATIADLRPGAAGRGAPSGAQG